MRPERFCTTTRIEHDGLPRYMPPALRGITGISQVSQLPLARHSKGRRDPPPHKDPPAQNPNCSDSPNWHTPSPNCPASFWSLLPPPQPPSILHISSLCPDIPSMPPKNHTGSQLTSDLVSLIKTTLEALQNIVHITERLTHKANAERRLAHKSRQMAWSLCEDARGYAVCPQPPVSPSGRGVPVMRSLGGLESIG